MGYHLHFYKPLNLSGQEIRDLFIKDIETKFKKYIEPYIETGRFGKEGKLLETLDVKFTPEHYKQKAALNRASLSKFQSISTIYELEDDDIYEYLMFAWSFENNTGIKLAYEEGKYYQQIPLCYRVSVNMDTDEERLYEGLFTNLQETLDYLKKQGYTDEELTAVSDFFNNNPDGYAGI